MFQLTIEIAIVPLAVYTGTLNGTLAYMMCISLLYSNSTTLKYHGFLPQSNV